MRPVLLLAALLPLVGCDTLAGGNDGLVCTLEFRSVGVEVVDTEGTPVGDLDAETVVVATGARLNRQAGTDDGPGGVYVVASDAHVDRLAEAGTALRFTAGDDTRVASAEFVISGGPCHISKMSGPERITLGPR